MELRQPVPSVARQVDVLMAAGLVERTGDRNDTLRARLDRVGELAKALAALEGDATGAGEADGGAWPHDGETAGRDPRPDGRHARRGARPPLVPGRRPARRRSRPSTASARSCSASCSSACSPRTATYPEKEVNQRLALFNPDVAALRRYLVDDGYVTRDAGQYRRAVPGPTSDAPAP